MILTTEFIHAVKFSDTVPVSLIYQGAYAVLIIVILGIAYRIFKWTRVVHLSDFRPLGGGSKAKIFADEFANRLVLQRDIIDEKFRYATHYLVFWGFLLAALTTTLAWLYYPKGGPIPLDNPIKLIGNTAAILMLLGGSIILGRIIFKREFREHLNWSDPFFFIMLYLTVLTGVLTEVLGIMEVVPAAQGMYIAHLVFLALLLASAPFTHFIHALNVPILRFIRSMGEKLSIPGQMTYKELRLVDYYASMRTKPQSGAASSVGVKRGQETTPSQS